MKKIEKLKKSQEKQIPKFIEKFVGMAQKPTDRKKATKAVQALYESAGFEKPIVIFGQSPLTTAIMVAMCRILFKNTGLAKNGSQLYSQLRSQLSSQLSPQLSSQLRSQLNSQLGSQLDSQLYSQLSYQLSPQLSSQLRSQLSSQLGSQLRSQLYSQLSSQLGSQLRSQLYSQLSSQLRSINNDWWIIVWWLVWAGWYSFGKYIRVEFDNKVYKIFMDFVMNVSFIIPYKGIAFVSETPQEINWENGLLHSVKDKAVKYADGYGLYSIHGVKFTEEQFKKSQTASISDILSWEDIDQRSVLLRDKPIEELLKKVPKTLIDKTEECGGYELYEIELKDIGKAKILSYKGWSSDKPYVKFVSPESTKCLETVAELRQQSVEELLNSIKS